MNEIIAKQEARVFRKYGKLVNAIKRLKDYDKMAVISGVFVADDMYGTRDSLVYDVEDLMDDVKLSKNRLARYQRKYL